jgi:hypothetical protein
LNEVKNIGRLSNIRDYIVNSFLNRMFHG